MPGPVTPRHMQALPHDTLWMLLPALLLLVLALLGEGRGPGRAPPPAAARARDGQAVMAGIPRDTFPAFRPFPSSPGGRAR